MAESTRAGFRISWTFLMAHTEDLCKGRSIRISYRKATFVVCACNLVVMLCMMYLILSPLYLRTSLPDPAVTVAPFSYDEGYSEQTHSQEDLERMKSSYKLRRALIPIRLIKEVKELQAETEADIKRTKTLSAARQKISIEVSQRLAQVKQSNTQSSQHGLQKWRKKKLQYTKRNEGRHQSWVSKWNTLRGANKELPQPPVSKNISDKDQ